MSGKGSTPRPLSVPREEFDARFDVVFPVTLVADEGGCTCVPRLPEFPLGAHRANCPIWPREDE